ncbi:four helix bundle protein [bacterium]|nr:four helix bundle protein [bacterium]
MSKYHHLNIYKKTYDFTVYFGQVLKHYAREYRYTLGEKILDAMFKLVIQIYKANEERDSNDRLSQLKDMSLILQYVNVALRLSHSLKCLSNDRYAKCSEYADEIDRQLTGWMTYTENQAEKQREKTEK